MVDKLIVLLIGSGGREHAFAWSLSKSPRVEKVLCVPGNGGTARCDRKVCNLANISIRDYPGLVQLSKSHGVNLVVPSCEDPLVDGIEKYFKDAGIAFFGPSHAAARLEGSKCFAKDFMQRHGIPTAAYRNFNDYIAAKQYLETVEHPVVIKASGLAAGKGVLMPTGPEENIAALRSVMLDKDFGDAGAETVIEELLVGDEISITFLTDGHTLRMFPAGQDHQRIYDGNVGANTGGMGVYAPTPILSSEQLAEIDRTILQPTIAGIRKEGHPFVGLICIGLIMASTGPKLLEYNVRFGDPEAQTLLPLLDPESDLAEIMIACTESRLHEVHMGFMPKSAASVVVAAAGYPISYRKGDTISIDPVSDGTLIFHAGTKVDGDTLITNGGRVLASVHIAGTLEDAVRGAYDGVQCIHFNGKYFRTDIAKRALEMSV